ncbi:TRAP transporter substrate-binding protein DctP [Herminiimonas sp. NPDC097707]|uniref:TRAP transporter substrate-binding protein DctP n=1 Tax=Herminiimonas sp. NPDC097707 TaxID=3364007 RepID=UPI00383BB3A1
MISNKFLKSTLSTVLIGAFALGFSASSMAATKVIKISHQFPGGDGADVDFRHRLAVKFAQDVEKRTNGELKFEIYPSASLVKPNSQFSAMQTGALDMTVLPLAYEGGKIPETNLGLMPALVTSYEQGLRWKTAPIGKALNDVVEGKGVKIITWVWQAGGVASKTKSIVQPSDAKDVKIRGGSKEMDMMLKGAGGSITNVPSSEIYNAMQTGVLDAAVTSSTSLLSFRLYEVAKQVTTARKNTFWFMFEPLLMAKSTYDSLTPAQQKIVMEVGVSLEKFAMEESKKDDVRLGEVYAKNGATASDMDDAAFAKWRELAKQTAWKNFAENVKNGQQLLDMAQAVK